MIPGSRTEKQSLRQNHVTVNLKLFSELSHNILNVQRKHPDVFKKILNSIQHVPSTVKSHSMVPFYT